MSKNSLLKVLFDRFWKSAAGLTVFSQIMAGMGISIDESLFKILITAFIIIVLYWSIIEKILEYIEMIYKNKKDIQLLKRKMKR
jgi:hypothetical protein